MKIELLETYNERSFEISLEALSNMQLKETLVELPMLLEIESLRRLKISEKNLVE